MNYHFTRSDANQSNLKVNVDQVETKRGTNRDSVE